MCYLANVCITGNELSVSFTAEDDGYGIYVQYEAYANCYDDASFTNVQFGDVIIQDNIIDVVGDDIDAIFVNIDLESDASNYGTADLDAGDLIISGNEITMVGDECNGIYLYGDYAYAQSTNGGNATLITGEVTASENAVTMTGDDCVGIYVDPDSWCIYADTNPDEHEGAGNMAICRIVGGWNIVDNVVSVDNSAAEISEGNDGIYIDDIYNYAMSVETDEETYGMAELLFDMVVSGNTITVTGSDSYGLELSDFELNVEYAYATVASLIAFGVENVPAGEVILREEGIPLVTADELKEL
jgi:hypothetical protein